MKLLGTVSELAIDTNAKTKPITVSLSFGLTGFMSFLVSKEEAAAYPLGRLIEIEVGPVREQETEAKEEV